MGATVTSAGVVAATAPVTRRVRAYFAPVDRTAGQPTVFDAGQSGRFALDTPPAPWVDLGWCSGFARRCGSVVTPLRTGAPMVTQMQVRTELEATVKLEFLSWGKLQLALASGAQQMNLLATAAAAPLLTTGGASTATSLNVGAAAAAGFSVGDVVAVDVDYTGQTGFVGSPWSGAYITGATTPTGDVDYVRRVTLNVQRVTAIANGVLQLGGALPGGAPTSAMQVSRVPGFVDREGGSFFQEWSGLFCMDGEQGDRVLFFYPRLQTMQGASETAEVLSGRLERMRLAGEFRALPVKDANDGETVLCYRSYLPAPMRQV